MQAAKLASIGELTTGIAHELNNPLNNIGLCIGNALDQLEAGHPNELIAQHLRTGMQQVHRGAAIINNLRTFGRAASAENEPLPINTVVASALQLIEAPLSLVISRSLSIWLLPIPSSSAIGFNWNKSF